MGNSTAYYYVGLRVVAEERDIPRGLELLYNNVPEDCLSTLACGIFSICAGNEDMAIHYLQIFGERHHRFGTEDVRVCGEEFKQELWHYRRLNNNTFKRSFYYPMCDSIPSPECTMECAAEYGPDDILCNDCYLWWLSRGVCAML